MTIYFDDGNIRLALVVVVLILIILAYFVFATIWKKSFERLSGMDWAGLSYLKSATMEDRWVMSLIYRSFSASTDGTFTFEHAATAINHNDDSPDKPCECSPTINVSKALCQLCLLGWIKALDNNFSTGGVASSYKILLFEDPMRT